MKTIYIDIDGTLLPLGWTTPPASAVEAIQTARKNGSKVFINTGRCRRDIMSSILQIGFDGLICSNSMYIEYDGEVVNKESLDENVVREIGDYLTEQGVGFFFEGHEHICANPLFMPQMRKRMGDERIAAMSEAFPARNETEGLVYANVAKINFLPSGNTTALVRERFPGLQINEWSFIGDEGNMCEILPLHADKANGVKYMLNRLGAKREDSYAFGDTGGDLGMVRFCGTGVAMGNGATMLKENADFVADDVEKDGLYKAFEQLGLLR